MTRLCLLQFGQINVLKAQSIKKKKKKKWSAEAEFELVTCVAMAT